MNIWSCSGSEAKFYPFAVNCRICQTALQHSLNRYHNVPPRKTRNCPLQSRQTGTASMTIERMGTLSDDAKVRFGDFGGGSVVQMTTVSYLF